MIRAKQSPSRRQVLRGAGGFSLAIPFLPSLLPRGAQAAATNNKRLWWITTDHGGAFEDNMFPAQTTLTNTMALFSDHPVKSGTLAPASDGTNTTLSPILKAKSGTFTPKLAGKMNVLYGLDVPFYISHNTGLHLGNYARNDGNSADSGGVVQKYPQPTIDQIMAWSSSFYPSLNGVRERVMVMGGRPISWNYADPSNQSSAIQNISGTNSSQALFTSVFGDGQSTPPMASRPAIVDRVLSNWQSLRQSNRRLSTADKARLDDYLSHLAELQRKLSTSTAPTCTNVAKPTDDAGNHGGDNPSDFSKEVQLFNDVVVAAFACGASRIGVMGLGETSRAVSYNGDWHQNVAHQWQTQQAQTLLVQSYQSVFETMFVDLASKLDAIKDSDGNTVLDNTLMVWSQECCMSTHDSCSIPVVTAGSAGGWFKTGQFVDYRRNGNAASMFQSDQDPLTGKTNTMYLGVLYAQWLGTVLQSMGLAPTEFERWGSKGYGYPFVSPESWISAYKNHYTSTTSRYFTMASDPLPFIKA